MAYKVGTEKINDLICKAMKVNRKVVVTYQMGDNYYEINEYVAFLEKIESVREDKLATLKLKFREGETIRTSVFIDKKSITEGCLVSVIGFISKDRYGLKLVAKGGINRIYTQPNNIELLYVNKMYRMGIVTQLSKFEVSKVYKDNAVSKFTEIGVKGFYFRIEELENLAKDIPNNCVDTSNQSNTINTSLYSSDEEIEDYPDEEVEDNPDEENKGNSNQE